MERETERLRGHVPESGRDVERVLRAPPPETDGGFDTLRTVLARPTVYLFSFSLLYLITWLEILDLNESPRTCPCHASLNDSASKNDEVSPTDLFHLDLKNIGYGKS